MQLLLQNEYIMLGFVFAAVLLVVFGAYVLLGNRAPARSLPATDGSRSLRYETPQSGYAAFLSRLGKQAADSYEANQLAQLRVRLIRAGFRNPAAVFIYYAIRLTLTIVLPVSVASFSYLIVGNLDFQRLMVATFAAAAAGLYVPRFWLSKRIESRQTAIRHGFPDALDMLLVCVEAGASLPSALQRVAQELADPHPVLSEELRLVSAGLSAGQSREQALRNLADRAGTDDVSAFATMMIQSEMFGTSISETLRVHAAEMRQKRMLRAEEMANTLPVKITFPLALMIFPVLLIVIMTPIILRIMDAMGHMMR